MGKFIWWFGVLHIGAYFVASFVLTAALFIDWLVKRLNLKAEMLRAYLQVLKDRDAAKKKDPQP